MISFSSGFLRWQHMFASRSQVLGVAMLALVCSAQSGAADLGSSGLHEQDWFIDSFRDVAEDVHLAAEQGRQVLILFEQQGCPYCARLHEKLLDDPVIRDALRERFDVVQYDLLGATEVTDLDGTELTESTAAARWEIFVTPTMLFLPAPDALETHVPTARAAAVAVLPGVPERNEFLELLERLAPHGNRKADKG